jgi:quinohemoprotein ethanol dehydrogenase
MRLTCLALAAVFVLAPARLSAQSSGGGDPMSARALVELPRDGWRTNGGNLYNQRYSPLTEIDRSNVSELKGVWQTRLRGSGVGRKYSAEGQPLVHDGVIYLPTGADDVFAIDVESGDILWQYEADLDQAISTVCCGWISRGVAIGEGLVYLGLLDGKLVALSQRTGELVWSVQAERWEDGYVITSAPLYYDGLVITGFAGAEYAQRGRVKAYRADTGEHVWTFYTVPGPGELGHDTWPEDSDIWMYGGGSVWQTPAADPELGLIYFATGNPGPDFNGAVRPGDNLFTASIVALEAETGAYRWHFQAVKHDIWDYDLPTPVVLFDIEIDGRMRRGLAGTGKTGWVYLLDRETGEPLVGMEDRAVPQEPAQATAATQPYPVGDAYIPQSLDLPPEGFDLVNQGRIFTPFADEPVVLKPNITGGANWPPSSYDPVTGLYYVCAADEAGVFIGGQSYDEEAVAGEFFPGGRFGSLAFPRFGIFAAIDVTTNRLEWIQHWPEDCYSGSVTTGGGLTFVGRNDGRLTALDSSNGALLWEFQTGAGANSSASVFEHEGTQYVVFYAGGNLFANTPRGDRVWLFSLNGQMGPEAAATALIPDAAEAVDLSAGEAEGGSAPAGRGLYVDACETCHGPTAEGGHNGVPLRDGLSAQRIYATLVRGRNDMPSFTADFSPEQLRDIVAYVRQLLNSR